MVRGAATGDEEAGARGGDGVWAAHDGVGGRGDDGDGEAQRGSLAAASGGEDELNEKFHKC